MGGTAFPVTGTVDNPEREPTVVDLDDAAGIIEALSSTTARDIVRALSDAPAPPSEVADRAGTSLQNAHYHLDRLEANGVLEVVDTWYSSRGVEMDVYAVVTDRLVLDVSGTDDDRVPRTRSGGIRFDAGSAVSD